MGVVLTAPGVYIEELPAASRTVVGVSTSRCAFLGRANRGMVDRPTRIFSFGDFERTFGGLWTSSDLGHVVRQFFQNGGSEALIVRLVRNAGTSSAELDVGGTAAILHAANPGKWADDLRLDVDVDVDVDAPTGSFNLTVRLTDGAGQNIRQEVWRNVSLNPTSVRYLPDLLAAGSAYVVFDVMTDGAPPNGRPTVVTDRPLTSGDDGDDPTLTEYQGSEANQTGLYALDRVPLFNLLCVPFPASVADADRATFWGVAGPYCERRRAFGIIDAPTAWATYDAASTDSAGFADSVRSTNAALYFPNVRASDPLLQGRYRDFPPCGFVAGVFARTDSTRGVWKAPAGNDASLAGSTSLSVPLTDAEHGALNRNGINALRTFPGYGRVVWGARTLRGADRAASEWKYVPVRRTMIFLQESLYVGTRWAVFEPNGAALWAQLRLAAESFLHPLFRQGAFAGKSVQDAYFVKCDAETTPQEDVDRGIVNLIIGVALLRPAEFVVVKIQQIANTSN